MSEPRRGMVAGQAIVTQAQTKEFDEGYERTFGNRKPVRGRFVYTSGGEPLPEPVEAGREPPPEARLQLMTDGHYDGLRATDGTPINSRTKHRSYMQAKGLTVADDYKGEWAKKYEERQAYRRGERVDPELSREIGRAAYERRHKRK